MKLTELLDTPPTEYDDVSADSDVKEIEFTTKRGQLVNASIRDHGNNQFSIDFIVNGSYEVTGKGEVSEIFSTILDFIKKSLDNLPPDSKVEISSHEPSRTKLYDRMLRTQLKPPYSYKIYGGVFATSSTKFIITKGNEA